MVPVGACLLITFPLALSKSITKLTRSDGFAVGLGVSAVSFLHVLACSPSWLSISLPVWLFVSAFWWGYCIKDGFAFMCFESLTLVA